MTRTVHLLAIDPQNDFCDLPADWRPGHAPAGRTVAPSLPVAGAHADMQRLAAFLRSNAQRIDAVTVTLDSHQRHDVAHPGFWRTGDGGAVAPFTPVTARQVRSGQFAPADAAALPRVLAYLDALEAQGRYTLMVWPVHCEIGSWGHGLHADVLAACGAWQSARQRAVQHVFKGMNPWTEHYSALQAEVPDPADPATALDTRLLQRLGASLEVSVIGTSDSSTITNWYDGTEYQLEQFRTSDGRTLASSQVDALVSAMASFAPPPAGQTTLTPEYQNHLSNVIATSWS